MLRRSRDEGVQSLQASLFRGLTVPIRRIMAVFAGKERETAQPCARRLTLLLHRPSRVQVAADVAKDFGKIDILIHSLANGPEARSIR